MRLRADRRGMRWNPHRTPAGVTDGYRSCGRTASRCARAVPRRTPGQRERASAFESIVMEHINSGERHLIVDFSRLDFISSVGLRVALLATRALQASQGRIVLCAMRKHIEEVFRISGFDRIIVIKESRQAALDVFA